MPRSSEAYLLQMQRSAQYLLRQAAGTDIHGYLADETLRYAVERNFITIGEAMVALRRDFADVAAHFPDVARIIAFRNFVVHKYWDIDNEEVWSTLITEVEPLLQQVEAVLQVIRP